MDRFWSKTKRMPNGCLEWQGALKKPSRRDGRGGQSLPHGVFWFEGRTVGAHRMAKALQKGVHVSTIGLVAHECDNPRCVDPEHLTESDASSNLQDAYDRGRRHLGSLCRWFEQNPITVGL